MPGDCCFVKVQVDVWLAYCVCLCWKMRCDGDVMRRCDADEEQFKGVRFRIYS